jgi:hypothetical protein
LVKERNEMIQKRDDEIAELTEQLLKVRSVRQAVLKSLSSLYDSEDNLRSDLDRFGSPEGSN